MNSKTKKIKMPKLSVNMESGVLVAWDTKEGADFKKGDVLFEVETDKVVHSVEATEDGKLLSHLAEEGDEIDVGAEVAAFES